MGSWLPTINVGDFVGNLVGDFKNGEKDLAVMKITDIIRCEGCGKTGVGVISISRHILFPFFQDADLCKVKRDESL